MRRLPAVTDPPEVWALLASHQGALAFDIGANVGQVASVLARNFTSVVAFEPCAESFAVLVAEAAGNVTPVEAAVSDRTGTVTLSTTEHAIATGQLTTGSALNWGPETGERTVWAIRLDAAADLYGPPDFVKIDTEGHEALVIAGGPMVLAKVRPRLLIEVHRASAGAEIEAMLDDGYDLRRIDHALYPADSPLRAEHFWLQATPWN